MEKVCRNCKWWDTGADWAYPHSDFGYCDNTNFSQGVRHEEDEKQLGWLDTRHDFGCIYFEERT